MCREGGCPWGLFGCGRFEFYIVANFGEFENSTSGDIPDAAGDVPERPGMSGDIPGLWRGASPTGSGISPTRPGMSPAAGDIPVGGSGI